MIGDAGEDIAEVGFGIEAVELGGFDERVDRGGALAAGIGAGEQLILAAEGHHPFILPMSGRSWKSITATTLISAGRFWCVAWSSE